MSLYLILAHSDEGAAALSTWLEVLDGTFKLGRGWGARVDDPRILAWDGICIGDTGVLTYEKLAKQVEMAARTDDGSIALNEVVVLVDRIRPAAMSVISETASWDHLIAMLILTFPEINWVFGVVLGEASGFPAGAHALSSLLSEVRRDPLLDATGLRDWVRKKANERLVGQGFQLPTRLNKAAAIDEEKSYAYLHAFAAYRFGFRADVVTAWTLMETLFRRSETKQQLGAEAQLDHGYYLLFEDMSLNFPDKPDRIHLSDLEQRAVHCDRLEVETEHSHHRILITTGQAGTNADRLSPNRAYLKRKPNGDARVLLKPVGGMLDLWKRARLLRRSHGQQLGNAPGFEWPPQLAKASITTGHGAPGKLMIIADSLIQRAEIFRRSASTVKDFIKGAVLATDASELLGGRTPTLTLSALALKHEYETRAECAFVGVGYHFEVKAREREIARVVHAISKWFAGKVRQLSELDANIVILNRLSIVFREAGQFEEEQQCLVTLRRHHRRLQMQRSANPITWALNGVLRYAELLLASFDRFVMAIVLWLLALSATRYAIDPATPPHQAISDVLGAFFGASPAEPTGWLVVGWSCLAVTAGFFHLGVFVSYIYSLISRK